MHELAAHSERKKPAAPAAAASGNGAAPAAAKSAASDAKAPASAALPAEMSDMCRLFPGLCQRVDELGSAVKAIAERPPTAAKEHPSLKTLWEGADDCPECRRDKAAILEALKPKAAPVETKPPQPETKQPAAETKAPAAEKTPAPPKKRELYEMLKGDGDDS